MAGRTSLPEDSACAEDESVESDVHGRELGQVSQAREKPAEQSPRSGQRARRGDHALVHADWAWGAALMESVSRTEEALADTLRAMARTDGSEAAARRRRLAEAAIRGSQEADEQAEKLRRLGSLQARRAGIAARHAEVTALLRLLRHAGSVLADLASAEEDIANTLTNLAGEDGPDLAAELRRLAGEARAAAQSARDRARALRRLAETSRAMLERAGAQDGHASRTGARAGTDDSLRTMLTGTLARTATNLVFLVFLGLHRCGGDGDE